MLMKALKTATQGVTLLYIELPVPFSWPTLQTYSLHDSERHFLTTTAGIATTAFDECWSGLLHRLNPKPLASRV